MKPALHFALAKEAFDGWALDISPAPFCWICIGALEVDGEKLQARQAVITQHFEPSTFRDGGHINTGQWAVEFQQEAEMLEQATFMERGDAMAAALAFCAGGEA
jgi:hypothetical protein